MSFPISKPMMFWSHVSSAKFTVTRHCCAGMILVMYDTHSPFRKSMVAKYGPRRHECHKVQRNSTFISPTKRQNRGKLKPYAASRFLILKPLQWRQIRLGVQGCSQKERTRPSHVTASETAPLSAHYKAGARRRAPRFLFRF